MQIGRHHFFVNLFAALRANDRNLAKNIIITELANQIIASPFTVREILAENGIAVPQNATSDEIATSLITNIPINQAIRKKIVDLIFSCNKLSFDGQPHYGNKKATWQIISTEKNKLIISSLLKEAMQEEAAGKLSPDVIGLKKQVRNKAKLFAFTEEEVKEPMQASFFKRIFYISIMFGTVCGAFALWYRYIEKQTD